MAVVTERVRPLFEFGVGASLLVAVIGGLQTVKTDIPIRKIPKPSISREAGVLAAVIAPRIDPGKAAPANSNPLR